MNDERKEIHNLINSLKKEQLIDLVLLMDNELKFLKEIIQIRIELM